ncbi:hypothetical protein GCK72_014597 [Caenorhabditis remanei]|uniref:Uncharacterized protein n=1 Tax=Caenorhabditis remanei TaxID=31234 RepID=A0A6A5GUD7_CAERE|nr:hypothetical protein GCK72_014597 [Caenorhabditis remanei]KAF1758139.1 hypothetical protein GCK72_014597 [Caenorhabditis remanei]
MKFAILLAAVCSVALAQNPGTDNCVSAQFAACNSRLSDFWRVDTSTAWKDLGTLDRITQSLLLTPYTIDSWINVCNGFSSFYGCLGQVQIRNCLGTVGLVGSGLALSDAYAYQGFMADWDFKCGVGFWTMYERQVLTTCIESTYVNYQQETAAALQTYTTATTQDPNNACKYAQNLMNAWQTTFQKGPCRTVNPAQAGWFGCQSAREWSNAQFKHCKHTTTCASPATVDPITRVNAETGKTEYQTHCPSSPSSPAGPTSEVSIIPGSPSVPSSPFGPGTPSIPVFPGLPGLPSNPSNPRLPFNPGNPLFPGGPRGPCSPGSPAGQSQGFGSVGSHGPLGGSPGFPGFPGAPGEP